MLSLSPLGVQTGWWKSTWTMYEAAPHGIGQVATLEPHFLLTSGGSHADLVA